MPKSPVKPPTHAALVYDSYGRCLGVHRVPDASSVGDPCADYDADTLISEERAQDPEWREAQQYYAILHKKARADSPEESYEFWMAARQNLKFNRIDEALLREFGWPWEDPL